ncbi:MAG: hypothetical protein P1P87_05755 [Trueperaceae bacterium]|nr:hypothetical protein [Trueperaceae bacterium]
MTETLPPNGPQRAHDAARPSGQGGIGAAIRRGWRALTIRTLVARKNGRDRMRVPLSIAAIVAVALLWWSWPLALIALAIALVARVEFVVVREGDA